MGVPRQRKTKSERNQRRSHHALSKLNLVFCKNCNKPVMPHVICQNCGHYRNRKVLDIQVPLPAKVGK